MYLLRLLFTLPRTSLRKRWWSRSIFWPTVHTPGVSLDRQDPHESVPAMTRISTSSRIQGIAPIMSNADSHTKIACPGPFRTAADMACEPIHRPIPDVEQATKHVALRASRKHRDQRRYTSVLEIPQLDERHCTQNAAVHKRIPQTLVRAAMIVGNLVPVESALKLPRSEGVAVAVPVLGSSPRRLVTAPKQTPPASNRAERMQTSEGSLGHRVVHREPRASPHDLPRP